MKKFDLLQKVKAIYDRGENIIKYLKGLDGNNSNSIEDILISYDFQSGAYLKGLSKKPALKHQYCQAMAEVINGLDQVDSIIEVGVGEATTLGVLISKLQHRPSKIFGFDISWSRLNFAQKFLQEIGLGHTQLFTANLFEIPLPDNSIDIVYTSHSIEPNGGKEEEALRELYRIAKKYVVLFEPSYQFGSDEAKARMEYHGYVTRLPETAKALGYQVIENRLLGVASNPLNPTGLIVIEKQVDTSNEPNLICPITNKVLRLHDGSALYSEEGLFAYPVLNNIPCLLRDNSILAVHLKSDYESFKTENDLNFSNFSVNISESTK